MNEVSFAMKLVLFFTTVVFIKQCASQPKHLFLEHLNSSSELEDVSLNYALDWTNANTSSQMNNSFVLELLNTSRHDNLLQYALALSQNDVVALIEGQHSDVPACALSQLTGIPLIRLHSFNDRCSKCDHVGVSLSASHASYARASVQLLETFHWSNVAVLYEETYVYESSKFETLVNKEEISVHVIQLYKQGNETMDSVVKRCMKELSNLKIEVVLLYADELYRHKLLSEKRLCDYAHNFLWILQNEFPLNLTAPSNDMVIGFRLPRKRNQKSEQYENSLKSRINNTIDLFSLQERVVLGHDAIHAIVKVIADVSTKKGWAQPSFQSSLTEQLKKVQLEGITGNIQFDESGLRTSVELDVMNLQNDSFVMIGTWSSTRLKLAQDLRKNRDLQGNNSKLEGRRFRVATAEYHPFVFFKRKPDGSITYEGYCIDLLEKLASLLKFTYDIQPSTDGNFGSEINGHWNGMIGELVCKKIDLAAAPLSVTYAREKVVDFMTAFTFTSLRMAMKKETTPETDLFQFMMPFDVPVWVMLLVCLIVISCATFTLNYFSPCGYKNETGSGTSSEFNFLNSVWFSLGCMLQQGADNTPKANSGRMLAGFYWFCILIWVSTYTANLAAFLTVKNAQQSIHDVKQALNSDYQIGVLRSSSIYSFFQTSNYELYQNVWQRMKSRDSFPNDSKQAMQWIRQKQYIHIGDSLFLQYQANKLPCDLVTVPGIGPEEGLSFALQSNDTHVEKLSFEILRLRRSGYLDELRRKWLGDSSACHKDKTVLSRNRIGVEQMTGVYIMLATGLLISFILLGVEIFWYKKGKDKMRNIRSIQVDPTKNEGDNYQSTIWQIPCTVHRKRH